MTAIRMLAAALLAGTAWWCVPEAHCERKDTLSRDETARMPPTAARLAIWTDRPGYLRFHDLIRVYLAMDPLTDRYRYHQFLYLENVDTRQRQYLEQIGSSSRLTDRVVTFGGESPLPSAAERVPERAPARLWSGRELAPGRWQFVAELRSPDTTEIVKRAYAKFVVSGLLPVVLGNGGRDTEITEDTTWTRDRIWAVRGHVFVRAGATLTIEPGTVVLGRGPEAVIVVERGGRIVARGRPDAPVVMSCDAPTGQRFAGCWGGLVVLGSAPMSRGTGLATGVAPAARAVYGGADAGDASGVLEYVRVEFAGAGSGADARPAGIGLYGVGRGTRLDHVQAHASAGDGILFSGGTVSCTYCVSSGAGGDALAWELGWQGTAQRVFLQPDPAAGGCGIDGAHDELAFDALPRSAPTLYNLTLVGLPVDQLAPSRRCGILLRTGSAITARNVIVLGFPAGAIVLRDNAESLFLDGTSSIGGTIFHAGADGADIVQLGEGIKALVGNLDANPMLVSAAYQPNPDPRPRLNSPALKVGAAAVPPSDGLLDTGAQHIGAFGDSNWLEEWTFFGPESDYRVPEAEAGEGGG